MAKEERKMERIRGEENYCSIENKNKTTTGNENTNKVSLESEVMFFENLVWMTSAEAAKYLRKSYGALRVMVCRGYIRPRKFRRRWYFKRYELDQLIENSI